MYSRGDIQALNQGTDDDGDDAEIDILHTNKAMNDCKKELKLKIERVGITLVLSLETGAGGCLSWDEAGVSEL